MVLEVVRTRPVKCEPVGSVGAGTKRRVVASGEASVRDGELDLAYIASPRASNAGAGANIQVGHVHQVYSRGEDLVDPDTGLKLGSTDRLIGSVRVTDVQEQFSVGTIENVTGVMKGGDRVR